MLKFMRVTIDIIQFGHPELLTKAALEQRSGEAAGEAVSAKVERDKCAQF